MKRKFALMLMVTMVPIIALSLFPACAEKTAPEPAEQKGNIVIGILDGLSGTMGGTVGEFVNGEKYAIRYINEELGGIDGHQLEVIIIDHKFDAALMQTGWDRLKNEGAPLILAYLGNIPVLYTAAQKDQIPILGGTVGGPSYGYPTESSYFFAQSPHTPGMVPSACRIIEKDWVEKGKAGTPKMAFDVITIGIQKQLLSKSAKMEMAKRDWDYIITYTSIAPADVTTQVLQVKEFGADYLFQMGVEQGAIVWLKELERQNFQPDIYMGPTGGTQTVKSACGKLIAGSKHFIYSHLWTQTDVPIISKFRELSSNWDPDVTWRSGRQVRAFSGFLVAAEALNRALENVGYDNLNGAAMKEAMETINEFEPMGYGTSWTWTPSDHHGLSAQIWYQWNEELELVPASDWDYLEPLPVEQRDDAWWYEEL